MKQELKEAVRELKCLLSLNSLSPRTEYKSLLNKNLDRRKQALSTIITFIEELPSRDEMGEIISRNYSNPASSANQTAGEIESRLYGGAK